MARLFIYNRHNAKTMKFIAILTCVLALSSASIANTKEATPARTLDKMLVSDSVQHNVHGMLIDETLNLTEKSSTFEAFCAAPVHFLTIIRKGSFNETFDCYNRVLRVRFVRPIKVLQNA